MMKRTVVSESALMKSERPVRHFGRCPNDLSVLACNLCRIRLATSKKIEVKDTADDVVLQSCLIRVIDFDVHPVRIEQEDTMGSCRAVLEVYWVVSIQICSGRYPISVARPESSGVVMSRQTECICVFTQTIDIGVCRQICLHSKILGFKYNRVRRRRE